MKMRPKSPGRQLNSPAEMLARATYLAFLGAGGAAAALVLVAAVTRDGRYLFGALIAGLSAGLARHRLARRDAFAASSDALDTLIHGGPAEDEAQIGRLVSLLREWDALEQKRGSPDFDPWAVQALRHDIRVLVETDPVLARLRHV